MTTRRHGASGGVRKLPSGRWQARYTGPDGAMRTFRAVKVGARVVRIRRTDLDDLLRPARVIPRLAWR